MPSHYACAPGKASLCSSSEFYHSHPTRTEAQLNQAGRTAAGYGSFFLSRRQSLANPTAELTSCWLAASVLLVLFCCPGSPFSLAPLIRAPALAQFFPSVYVRNMTQAVAQILGEVEQLSEKERQQLRRAIVERVPMSDDLTDDDFAALAAASFRALDEEENTPRA
jgi:hypothetical protein